MNEEKTKSINTNNKVRLYFIIGVVLILILGLVGFLLIRRNNRQIREEDFNSLINVIEEIQSQELDPNDLSNEALGLEEEDTPSPRQRSIDSSGNSELSDEEFEEIDDLIDDIFRENYESNDLSDEELGL